MATITEDYCSQEVYRLLREKGFDGEIHTTFDKEGYTQASITLQMAMKWLREVHNIHIAVVPCEVGPGVMDYTYILYKVDTENFYFTDLGIQGRADTDKMSASKTCEAAIKYCLENLI